MGWDDGSWSKWTEPTPGNQTYHVCHRCLLSPRSYWLDLFLLCQKAGVGTFHLAQSELSAASKSEDLCNASPQQSEATSKAEHYRIFEDPFEHSPLDHDQFRLLSLLPGEDDLLCTIENVDLDSVAAPYEALSYCWGTTEQAKRTIWINGHPFEILQNLYAALVQLRKPTSTRKLWIDAICIDQVGDEGKAERNIQIPLMGRIYHQAAGVVVWLGSGAPEHDSDNIMDIIAQQNVEAMQSNKFAVDFGHLLKRPWFRRTWIVQEFVLGKRLPLLVCGSRLVSYGKFMATHWVLPMLIDRFPDRDIIQSRQIVDLTGNIVSTKTFKRMHTIAWNNHDEAEKTLANLMNVRRTILDDEIRLLPKPLYKVLPFLKDFDVTDYRDKIYGTFGVISPSVGKSIQVSYHKPVAEVYRDAMTYMLRQGEDEPGAVDLYLEYPLSLSLDRTTPGLPSWVPDFSRNSPFLFNHEDITWYWLYHQNLTRSHKPLLQKQHGRHRVNRDEIDRRLLSIEDARLTVSGFLVGEVDAVVESTFFGLNHEIRDYSERQLNSSSEVSRQEGHQIKLTLDVYEKNTDQAIAELTTCADDLSIFFASTLLQRYRIHNLYLINELCRAKFPTTARSSDPESWLTSIWRDLLEGYPAIDDVSKEEFDEQFFDITQSDKSMTGENWVSNAMRGAVRNIKDLPPLNQPIRYFYRPQRTFFTTRTSGFYGLSVQGVKEGDKLAFLFPRAYMAFILRPVGENFRMLGPCIVPPCLRDRALRRFLTPAYQKDTFVII